MSLLEERFRLQKREEAAEEKKKVKGTLTAQFFFFFLAFCVCVYIDTETKIRSATFPVGLLEPATTLSTVFYIQLLLLDGSSFFYWVNVMLTSPC